MKKFAAFMMTCLFSLTACASASRRPQTPPATPEKAAVKKLEYLIALKDTVTADQRQALWKKYGLEEKEKVGSSELYLVELPAGSQPEQLIPKIESEMGVRYAEPNMQYRILPNSSPTKQKN